MTLIITFILMLSGALASLYMGAADAFDQQIFWILRLPRTIAGIAVGGGLAVAGAIVQASLGNPLADPFTLGIASAAALGSVIGALVGFAGFYTSGVFAFVFALTALFSMLIWLRHSFRNSTEILLAGLVSGLFFTSLATFVMVISDPAAWATNLGWLLGSLATLTEKEAFIALVVVIACSIYGWFHWKVLDLLSVDELMAETAGVDIAKYRRNIFILVSLMTAVCVTVAGIIGFVGFIIPHTLRVLGVRSHRVLIPSAFFAGAGVLLFSDVAARVVARPSELPVGIVMSLMGAPAFLALMKKRRSGA